MCCDFLKFDNNELYDNIIMNPPYIRIQDLEPNYRKFLKNTFPLLKSGNIDIYIAFVIKCLNLLKDDGIMIAITPNSYLFNKSSKKFRKYLISNKLIKEIIDFNSKKVFEGVSVYCAITIFTKEPKDYLVYNGKKINYKNIKDDIFENIEHNKILKKFINATNGIATLRDKIFIHDEKLYEEPCWKKIFKVSKNKGKWIIYPYTTELKIINEKTFQNDNPKTYEYLENNKEELLKRDKGKKKYDAWYGFGRRQGLKLPQSEKVLYISTMGDINFPIYEREPMLYYSGLCISLKNNSEYTLDNIKDFINKNRVYISTISSKRGNGWFNISGTSIKKINIT